MALAKHKNNSSNTFWEFSSLKGTCFMPCRLDLNILRVLLPSVDSSVWQAISHILSAFDNYDSMKNSADMYAKELLDAKYSLAQKIIDVCGK